VIGDVGQPEDLEAARKKALATGASSATSRSRPKIRAAITSGRRFARSDLRHTYPRHFHDGGHR